MSEIQQMLQGKMKEDEISELIEEMFTDTFEQDSWMNQYAKTDRNYHFRKRLGQDNPQLWGARSQSQQEGAAPPTTVISGRDKDAAEIYQDINFFRDLGPLSRQRQLF